MKIKIPLLNGRADIFRMFRALASLLGTTWNGVLDGVARSARAIDAIDPDRRAW